MVSYKEVKQYTTLQAVAEWLGLRRRAPDRYDCPRAPNGHRAITLSPEWPNKDGSRGRFTCWACDVSGDLIALAAHINKTDDVVAAKEVMKTFHGYQPAKKGLPPEGLEYIDTQHDAVKEMGFDLLLAAELGLGFAPRGTMRNHIVLPMRDEKGRLRGYIGIKPGTELKLPKDFRAN